MRLWEQRVYNVSKVQNQWWSQWKLDNEIVKKVGSGTQMKLQTVVEGLRENKIKLWNIFW